MTCLQLTVLIKKFNYFVSYCSFITIGCFNQRFLRLDLKGRSRGNSYPVMKINALSMTVQLVDQNVKRRRVRYLLLKKLLIVLLRDK